MKFATPILVTLGISSTTAFSTTASSVTGFSTTGFSGGGYTTTTRTDKGTKVDKFPSINAKVSTTTQKKKGGKLKTDVKFKGNL